MSTTNAAASSGLPRVRRKGRPQEIHTLATVGRVFATTWEKTGVISKSLDRGFAWVAARLLVSILCGQQDQARIVYTMAAERCDEKKGCLVGKNEWLPEPWYISAPGLLLGTSWPGQGTLAWWSGRHPWRPMASIHLPHVARRRTTNHRPGTGD